MNFHTSRTRLISVFICWNVNPQFFFQMKEPKEARKRSKTRNQRMKKKIGMPTTRTKRRGLGSRSLMTVHTFFSFSSFDSLFKCFCSRKVFGSWRAKKSFGWNAAVIVKCGFTRGTTSWSMIKLIYYPDSKVILHYIEEKNSIFSPLIIMYYLVD